MKGRKSEDRTNPDEVYGVPTLPNPIQMNHIHLYPVDIPAIGVVREDFRRDSRPARMLRLRIETKDHRNGRPSRRERIFFAGRQAAGPHQGPLARSHRLRSENLEQFVKRIEAHGIG